MIEHFVYGPIVGFSVTRRFLNNFIGKRMLSYVISTTFPLQMQNELSIYKGKKYINTFIRTLPKIGRAIDGKPARVLQTVKNKV